MKNLTLLLSLFLLGILLMPNVLANGNSGCCVIQKDECTYWDMSGWGQTGEDFCNKLPLWGYALSTIWYDTACADIPPTQGCNNGFDIPEFNTVTAGLALIGAGMGFILLRRKR